MNPSLAVVTLNGILVSLLQIPHGYDVDFFCLNSIVPTWWGWNDILVYIGSSSRFLASWTQVSCSWVVACRCNYLCWCSVCRLEPNTHSAVHQRMSCYQRSGTGGWGYTSVRAGTRCSSNSVLARETTQSTLSTTGNIVDDCATDH